MRNDRKAGLMVIETKRPFKVSEGGQYVDKTKIVCKDIGVNEEAEYIAMDLQQLLMSAMFDMANNVDRSHAQNTEEEDTGFYDNNSPSTKEVDEVGNGLMTMVNMSTKVKMSDFIRKFVDLIGFGLFEVDGKRLNMESWGTIGLQDKQRIVFNYIAFFVNPLQNVASSTGKKEDAQPDLFTN